MSGKVVKAKNAAASGVSVAGLRDKIKIKTGVVENVLKPKDSRGFNFSDPEVPMEWPARYVSKQIIHPTGSPTFAEGSEIHFNIIVPANSYMRFSAQCLNMIVGLVMSVPGVGGAPPTVVRLEPKRVRLVEPETNMFVPECAAGTALTFVERIELMLSNTVVKSCEMIGGALLRYTGLANRTAGAKYGPDMKTTEVDYFLPMTASDLSSENSGERLTKFCAGLQDEKNGRYAVRSAIYGFPFEYDPVLNSMRKIEDKGGRFFGPGTHLEVRLFLKSDFGRILRGLTGEDGNTRRREREQRGVIDKIWLEMEKITFPQGSQFLKAMEAEFVKTGYRKYPFTSPNELRTPILPNMSEQTWTINPHQIIYPVYGILGFAKTAQVDGLNGETVNNSAFVFPDNLESIDILYGTTSLLPGGPITKLNMPGMDTADSSSTSRRRSSGATRGRTTSSTTVACSSTSCST